MLTSSDSGTSFGIPLYLGDSGGVSESHGLGARGLSGSDSPNMKCSSRYSSHHYRRCVTVVEAPARLDCTTGLHVTDSHQHQHDTRRDQPAMPPTSSTSASLCASPAIHLTFYQMTTKRIHREIVDAKKEDLGAITLAPTQDSLYRWKATIPGPQGSPYEGGAFNVDIQLASDYP